jgi:hypothetical protein
MNVEKAVQESCIQAETIKVDKHPRDHGPRGDDDSGTQYRRQVSGGRHGRVRGRDQEGLWRNKAKIDGRGIEIGSHGSLDVRVVACSGASSASIRQESWPSF